MQLHGGAIWIRCLHGGEMKGGVTYVEFVMAFRAFLKKRKYASPSDFHADLRRHMKKAAPSLSAIWMAFYGARSLPPEVILFMIDRYGFEIDWHQVLPIRNQDGTVSKTNQLALPGMRELK